MDEVRRVTRQGAAATLISPREREEAVQVMLDFLAWLEKSKDLTLCHAFKPQFDWYMPTSANRERLAACRTFPVSAPGVILAQGKARRSEVWSFQMSEPQRRPAPKAPPARRVERMSGVCGLGCKDSTLGNGTTIARAPRLASVRSCAQRVSRGKPDRLLTHEFLGDGVPAVFSQRETGRST